MKIGRYEVGGDGSEDTKTNRWEEQLPFSGDCGFVMQSVGPVIRDPSWASVWSLMRFIDERFETKRILRTSMRLESLKKTGSSESFISW